MKKQTISKLGIDETKRRLQEKDRIGFVQLPAEPLKPSKKK